jgi:hypothetical protein
MYLYDAHFEITGNEILSFGIEKKLELSSISDDSCQDAASGSCQRLQLPNNSCSSQLRKHICSSQLSINGCSSQLPVSGCSSQLPRNGFSSQLSVNGCSSRLPPNGCSSQLPLPRISCPLQKQESESSCSSQRLQQTGDRFYPSQLSFCDLRVSCSSLDELPPIRKGN